jgi:hypothetical protein
VNYYALILPLSGANLSAYDPESGQINRIPDVPRIKGRNGVEIVLLAPQYYLSLGRIFNHDKTSMHIDFLRTAHPTHKIQIITPNDPQWNEIHSYHNQKKIKERA